MFAFVFLICIASSPLYASNGIPVVVMAEDSDPNSLRRSSDVFSRVISETQELMNRYDFMVLDEQFIAARHEWIVADRRPRTELVQFVELSCTTGDATLCPRAMVLLKIRAGAKPTSFGTKAWVRLTGDIFDSATNSYVGGWEPVRKEFPAPRDCTGFCLEEVIGDKAREVAISLADVLRKKLAYLARGGAGIETARVGGGVGGGISTDYLFNFRYFSMREILEITQVMETEFPCFKRVRGANGDAINYTYNYTSCAPNNKLHGWMAVLLTDMGFDESTFKITLNGQRELRVEKIVGNKPSRPRVTGRFN
jgi:hypothetical protein